MWGLLLFIVTAFFLFSSHQHRSVVSHQDTARPFKSPAQRRQTPSPVFDAKTRCLHQGGWSWREYDSLAWCETFCGCGQAAPDCPGGNDHWAEIRDNSRVCESPEAEGYRIYCHPQK